MAARINFWFSVGSTYTYLAVMRLKAEARAAEVAVDWRPFSVRALMIEQNNIPFLNKPLKTRYMWRDIERRASMYGLSPVLPAPYPLARFDFANHIAVVAAEEGWCEDYATEAYRRWFEHGQEPGTDPVVEETLAALGQSPERVMRVARDPRILQTYETQTDQARGLGVFGSPTFEVGGELFWGHDRMADALTWARQGALAPPP